jgi:hypothetical protein
MIRRARSCLIDKWRSNVGEAAGMRGAGWLARGRLREAREQFWLEFGAARAANDSIGSAEAALGLGGLWVHEHRSTFERARVLAAQRAALADLDESSALAARLRVRLAAERTFESGDGAIVTAELANARAHDDPIVAAEAVSLTHHCLLGPHFAAERATLADELLALAAATGRPTDQLMGLVWRTCNAILAGDDRARRSLSELRKALEAEPCDALAFVVAAWEVMLTIRAGRLGDAERMAEDCFRLGTEVGDVDALNWYGAQLIAIRWAQGRMGELLGLVDELDQSCTIPELGGVSTAALAAVAASAGDEVTARSALARLGAGRLGCQPRGSVWLVTLAAVCDAANALADAEAASEAYELLVPFSTQPVLVGLGVACFGSVHRPLGIAALTFGNIDLAIDHLESAVAANLALGNLPAYVASLATAADLLVHRNDAGDSARAERLQAMADRHASECEMAADARQWLRLPPPCNVGVAKICQSAKTCTVSVGERVVVVRPTVGLRYLAELTNNPGRWISAVALVSSHGDAGPAPRCEPVLDDIAKAHYRARIGELRAEIDDADLCADLERASRARLEMDELIEQLSRVSGLRGATRSFVDDRERARVAVRKAITRALHAIAKLDPDIARELEARVVTGSRCMFDATGLA